MLRKLNRDVLPLLVAAIDRAAFRTGLSFPDIIGAAVAAHPEAGCSDEDWNRLGEAARTEIIDKARRTIDAL